MRLFWSLYKVSLYLHCATLSIFIITGQKTLSSHPLCLLAVLKKETRPQGDAFEKYTYDQMIDHQLCQEIGKEL